MIQDCMIQDCMIQDSMIQDCMIQDCMIQECMIQDSMIQDHRIRFLTILAWPDLHSLTCYSSYTSPSQGLWLGAPVVVKVQFTRLGQTEYMIFPSISNYSIEQCCQNEKMAAR